MRCKSISCRMNDRTRGAGISAMSTAGSRDTARTACCGKSSAHGRSAISPLISGEVLPVAGRSAITVNLAFVPSTISPRRGLRSMRAVALPLAGYRT